MSSAFRRRFRKVPIKVCPDGGCGRVCVSRVCEDTTQEVGVSFVDISEISPRLDELGLYRFTHYLNVTLACQSHGMALLRDQQIVPIEHTGKTLVLPNPCEGPCRRRGVFGLICAESGRKKKFFPFAAGLPDNAVLVLIVEQ